MKRALVLALAFALAGCVTNSATEIAYTPKPNTCVKIESRNFGPTRLRCPASTPRAKCWGASSPLA